MEGYIEKEEVFKEEKVEEEEDKFTLNSVLFRDKNLEEWEGFLSVSMPPMPAMSGELSKTLALLNDKFQISYNCFNELTVLTKKTEMTFRKKLNESTCKIIDDLKAKGVSRLPAMETVENMAMKNNDRLLYLKNNHEIHEVIKVFFEQNKNKLGVLIKSTSDLLFAANHSDRMFHKTERTGGL